MSNKEINKEIVEKYDSEKAYLDNLETSLKSILWMGTFGVICSIILAIFMHLAFFVLTVVGSVYLLGLISIVSESINSHKKSIIGNKLTIKEFDKLRKSGELDKLVKELKSKNIHEVDNDKYEANDDEIIDSKVDYIGFDGCVHSDRSNNQINNKYKR